MTDLNPYLPPTQADGDTRNATELTRQALADLIQRFLNSELKAFEFAEQLEAFVPSQDPMIKYAANAVWHFYDDCQDHFVCLDKHEWDFLQRLLLALHSDCQIEIQRSRRWSIQQALAASALMAYIFFAFQVGWSWQLYLLAVPFGLVSMAISVSRQKINSEETPPSPWTEIIYPFASFADLSAAYHRSTFRKTRFPKELAKRTIRTPLMQSVTLLHSHAMWLMHAPFVLIVQTFPETCQDVRILANSGRAS